jgi:LL-diaminopimelate aminotransferase
MIRMNENYLKLHSSYLFRRVAKRVAEFQNAHPDQEVIRMGIGDITHPLPPACLAAFEKAVKEMATRATGYGPAQGYPFLREKIAAHDFQARGADIAADEIFVSDGSKSDAGNIQELFADNIKVALQDPGYPVYLETNVMAGRTGAFENGRYRGVVYLESTAANHFIPRLPAEPVDLIYLCFPNNPTGATMDAADLQQWVDYARDNNALILFDAAYEAFIRDENLPRSIFEIPGAREVAVELRSFSKSAGFTGTRCAYIVVPKSCRVYDSQGTAHNLHDLWQRRQATKFNGVFYAVQRAAEAAYSPEGRQQIREIIDYYMANADLIRREISALGLAAIGGENAPYIWINTGRDAWEFFDTLLHQAGVVCTPGTGFGRCGENYVRISAFNHYEQVQLAMDRIKPVLQPIRKACAAG